MKLLIAEDDLTSRTILSAVTKIWGFDPVTAEDGEAAWEVLQADEAPQLLLLDWEMPKLDGLALCKRIREIPRDDQPYIILLSGRSETDDIVHGLDIGANDYIAKPFKNEELLARLNVGKRMLDMQTELRLAHERLAFEASHDAMTGLLNRGAIMKALDVEIVRANRQSKKLGVAFLDIDYFKQVNDTYGHLSGDHVLREVSKRILGIIRPYDFVGRYGGEEFLLLVNDCGDDISGLFERIRCVVADTPFKLDHADIIVTMSAGVTIYDPLDSDDIRDINALLSDADASLYKAKDSGRNRTVFDSKTA